MTFDQKELADNIRRDLKKHGPRRYAVLTPKLRRFIETYMKDLEIVQDGLDQVVCFRKIVVKYLDSNLGFTGEEGWYFGKPDSNGNPVDPVGPYASEEEASSDIPKEPNT